MTINPDISIVVRSRNESTDLQKLLSKIKKQSYEGKIEIIVVDNSSEDNTVEIALGAGARLVTISQNEFSHGRALNLGVQHCTHDYVFLISPHCILLGNFFLKEAVSLFITDKKAAALRCIRVNNPNDIIRSIEKTVCDASLLNEVDDNTLFLLPAATCCLIRKSAWAEVKFSEEIESNEDKGWMIEVLRLGYTILSTSDSYYYYSRSRSSLREKMSRFKRLEVSKYKILGIGRINVVQFVVRVIKFSLAKIRRLCLDIAYMVACNYIKLNLNYYGRKQFRFGSIKEYELKKNR